MDWGSGTPAYKQVAEALRTQIIDEHLKPGTALPSLQNLMDEHGVSITVARMAIRELKNEGLVKVAPGKGNFVGDGRPDTAEFSDVMRQLAQIRECVEELSSRLGAVESQVGLQPETGERPDPPTGRRGRQ